MKWNVIIMYMYMFNLFYVCINLSRCTVIPNSKQVSLYVIVRVCVFLLDNSKSYLPRNIIFEYVAVCENKFDKFDQGHYNVQMFSPYTAIQTIRSYNSTLEH